MVAQVLRFARKIAARRFLFHFVLFHFDVGKISKRGAEVFLHDFAGASGDSGFRGFLEFADSRERSATGLAGYD